MFEIKNHKSINNIKLDSSIISKFIRFTISDVYSSGNNGGAFKVHGIKCNNNKFTPSADTSNDQTTITLKCIDNINTNQQLSKKTKTIG